MVGLLALLGLLGFLVALPFALRVLPPGSARASLPLLDRSLAPEHRHAHVLGLRARLAHARCSLAGETVGSVGSVYISDLLPTVDRRSVIDPYFLYVFHTFL